MAPEAKALFLSEVVHDLAQPGQEVNPDALGPCVVESV